VRAFHRRLRSRRHTGRGRQFGEQTRQSACIANTVQPFFISAERRKSFPVRSGVVKTHRLPLHTIESAHQFTDNPGEDESYITIGPKMLKDIIEHFPSVRGNKGDPQLVWGFANSEVIIRSMETSLDTRGNPKLRQTRPTKRS
jgi:hypothetical protein